MLYNDYEADISRNNLVAVFSKVTKPLCLIGGWAVYLTVTDGYKAAYGQDYHGSKDIDLGFHFSKAESEESIKNSAFSQSMKALEDMGFHSQSFRLVQYYHIETKRALTIEESKKIPQHDLFGLYVDLMVDNVPADLPRILKITPADEKLLRLVFEKGNFTEVTEFGVTIRLPKPEILLATKLISLPNRTKDHKKWKDIADIYALIWHSNIPATEIKSRLLKILPQEKITQAFSNVTDFDYAKAANAINVPPADFKKVIDNFAKGGTNQA